VAVVDIEAFGGQDVGYLSIMQGLGEEELHVALFSNPRVDTLNRIALVCRSARG